jgi:hypothetical protein
MESGAPRPRDRAPVYGDGYKHDPLDSGVLAAAAALAVGEVKGQQVLGKDAVGGRLVLGRVVGADAAWDRFDDDIVVRPEEERAGVARAVVAIDDAVRRRSEPVVRVAR